MTNDSTSGGVFTRVTNTSWAENITWNTMPAIDGTQLASLSAVASNTFYDVDMTAAITGNGSYSGTAESLRPLNPLMGQRASGNSHQRRQRFSASAVLRSDVLW